MKRILYFLLITFILVSCNNDITNSIEENVLNTKPNTPRINDPVNNPDGERTPAICHNDYRILKGNSNNWNFLSFENFGYRGVGKCRGHAIVTQKFSELARFNKEGICSENKESTECKEHVDIGISKILNFEAFTFEGFNNLFEFSNTHYIEQKLKAIVRGISHRYSAGRADIRDYNETSVNESIFNEIILRIKEKQLPYIGVKGSNLGHHAILGFDVDFKDGKEIICVRDSNIIQRDTGELCLNYLFMDRETDKVFYQRQNKDLSTLYVFSLTNDEDKRVQKYISAQYNFCLENQK